MDSDYYLGLLAIVNYDYSLVPPVAGVVCALVVAVLLLIMSAFVSASEAAFFTLSSDELDEIKECRTRNDARLVSLFNDLGKLQATVFVANSFMNVMAVLLLNFAYVQLLPTVTPAWRCVLVLLSALLLLMLFGSTVPKLCTAGDSLKLLRLTAPSVTFMRRLFYPLVWLYAKGAAAVNRASAARRRVSVDELSYALELTEKKDVSDESNILKGIVRFGDETVSEVMTPRLDMVDIDVTASFDELLDCIVANVYSRIPVYDGTRDNIKGILYIKDLLPYLDKRDGFKWQSLIRQPFFVPETKKIDDLLKEFQQNKVHIAIVVDEFGGTSGLITMEDIIEEIVGDIQDEYDDDEKLYAKLNDTTFVFEGKILLSDFYKVIGSEPEEVERLAGDSDTLAGLLLEVKGEFPSLHEHIRIGIYDFEVLNIDKRRILKVKLTINEK